MARWPSTCRVLAFNQMGLLEGANAAFRFVLELCGLAALGYWGFQASDFLPMQFLLGIGAPIGFAFLWGASSARRRRTGLMTRNG